jgi:hypothetical protein
MTVAADADADSKRRSDEVREAIERSRRLRDQMIRSGGAVVDHLRRAAELRRRAGRFGR